MLDPRSAITGSVLPSDGFWRRAGWGSRRLQPKTDTLLSAAACRPCNGFERRRRPAHLVFGLRSWHCRRHDHWGPRTGGRLRKKSKHLAVSGDSGVSSGQSATISLSSFIARPQTMNGTIGKRVSRRPPSFFSTVAMSLLATVRIVIGLARRSVRLLTGDADSLRADDAFGNSIRGGVMNHRTGRFDQGDDPAGWYERD